MKYPIVEIFTSIQGEGVNLGKAANFIRFAGCNLDCEWCDTEWRKFKEKLTIEEILRRLDPTVKLVILTGGEPLMQKELFRLVVELAIHGYSIAIETNGTYPTKTLKGIANIHVSCSPKPQNQWGIHPDCEFDELKYVIDEKITHDQISISNKPIWLQPEGGNMQNAWEKALKIQKTLFKKYPNVDIRIGVQLHKIMEVR